MSLAEQQRLAVKEAYVAYYREPTNAHKVAAKEILADAEAPATAVTIAARHFLGPQFLAYEPETLWLELPMIHVANRDKLMAAISLAMTPSFYWDYRVFGATVDALNHHLVRTVDVPKNTVADVAWAVYEAELLFALTDGEASRPEFDEPVIAYIVALLLEEGYVCCPTGLSFADDMLKEKLPAAASLLRGQVLNAWAETPKEPFEAKNFPDNSLGARLLHLADVFAYSVDCTRNLRTYLARL